MNGIEKNPCIMYNTVLINSTLMCWSTRSEALMYLQEKNDQKSQIFKSLVLCKSQTFHVLICFSKQMQNPSTPPKCKPWSSLAFSTSTNSNYSSFPLPLSLDFDGTISTALSAISGLSLEEVGNRIFCLLSLIPLLP